MQFQCAPQVRQRFIQRPTLGNHRDLQTFCHVPAFAFRHQDMNGRSRIDFRIRCRRIAAPTVADALFACRRSTALRSAKWWQDFVDAPPHAAKIWPSVRVVLRCVLTAPADDVSADRTLVQMRQGAHDLMRTECPVVPVAKALSCGKDLRMDRQAFAPVPTVSSHFYPLAYEKRQPWLYLHLVIFDCQYRGSRLQPCARTMVRWRVRAGWGSIAG